MDPIQIFVIAGVILVVSLLLIAGGIFMFRSQREEDTAKGRPSVMGASTAGGSGARAADPDGPSPDMEQPGQGAPAQTGPETGAAPAGGADNRSEIESAGGSGAAAAGAEPDAAGPRLKGRMSDRSARERRAIPVRGSSDPKTPPEGMVEILRVYRDPFDAQLSVQVLGQGPEAVGEMNAARLAQLKRVVREIAERVDGVPEPSPGAETEAEDAQPLAAGEDEVGGGERALDVQASPGEDAIEKRSPPGDAPLAPKETFADTLPPQPEIRDMLPFRRGKPKKEEESEPPEPPKSIAAQIDEIVQSLLPGSDLAGREIHLAEVPGGGLQITHSGRRYEGIDEIEDPAVKALIKEAVRVWNDRNKLGSG